MDASIKTVSLIDSDKLEKTTKTVSLIDSDKVEKTSFDIDYTKNQTTTEICDDTKEISLENVFIKKNIEFKTIQELLKIPKYTCIKYKLNNRKIQWGILIDIILFNNATLLILKKGNYTWKHQLNFNKTIYFYTK